MTHDNTSVLVAAGSGPGALIAAPIAPFGARFGVQFVPHAIGNPDRKAHVERLFHYVEHNFLPGRAFADWPDINAQARAWCESVANQKVKRSLGTSPRAAFEQERPALRPLPAHQPAVCVIAHRVVDTEGYVHLETNRYSVPERLLGKAVEVYQYFETVAIYVQGREVARHPRAIGQRDRRLTAAGHHGPPRTRRNDPPPAQQALLVDAPAVRRDYVQALVAHAPGRGTARLKRLLQLSRTDPTEPFLAALAQGLAYGLYDLPGVADPQAGARGLLPAPGGGLMRAALHTLLAELHFAGMSQTLDRVLDGAEQAGDPPAAVRLALLREESRHRQERSLVYRLQQARLPWDWSLDTFPFARQPSVDAYPYCYSENVR